MTYSLITLDGDKITIHAAGNPQVGRTYRVTAAGKQYSAKYATAGTFVEASKSDAVLRIEDLLMLAGVGACAAIAIGAIVLSVSADIGNAPDADVLAAAAQTGKAVRVEASEYSQWGGCDSRDSRLYRVYDTATDKQIAIVCRGTSLTLFGVPAKAPTLRYQSE